MQGTSNVRPVSARVIHPALIEKAQAFRPTENLNERCSLALQSPVAFIFENGAAVYIFVRLSILNFQTRLATIEDKFGRFESALSSLGFSQDFIEDKALHLFSSQKLTEGVIKSTELLAEFVERCGLNPSEKAWVRSFFCNAFSGKKSREVAERLIDCIKKDNPSGLKKAIASYDGMKGRFLNYHVNNKCLAWAILFTDDDIEARYHKYLEIGISCGGRFFRPYQGAPEEAIFSLLLQVSSHRAALIISEIDIIYGASESIYSHYPSLVERGNVDYALIINAHIRTANNVLTAETQHGNYSYAETSDVLAKAHAMLSAHRKRPTNRRILKRQIDILEKMKMGEKAANEEKNCIKALEYYEAAYQLCLNEDAFPYDLLLPFAKVICRRYVALAEDYMYEEKVRYKGEASYLQQKQIISSKTVSYLRRIRSLLIKAKVAQWRHFLYRQLSWETISDKDEHATWIKLFWISNVFLQKRDAFHFPSYIRGLAKQKMEKFVLGKLKNDRDRAKELFAQGYVGTPLSLLFARRRGIYFGREKANLGLNKNLTLVAAREVDMDLLPESSNLLFQAAEKSGLLAVSDLTVHSLPKQLELSLALIHYINKGEPVDPELLAYAVHMGSASQIGQKNPLQRQFQRLKAGYLHKDILGEEGEEGDDVYLDDLDDSVELEVPEEAI